MREEGCSNKSTKLYDRNNCFCLLIWSVSEIFLKLMTAQSPGVSGVPLAYLQLAQAEGPAVALVAQ